MLPAGSEGSRTPWKNANMSSKCVVPSICLIFGCMWEEKWIPFVQLIFLGLENVTIVFGDPENGREHLFHAAR